jgi:hypothetical protein
MNDLVLPDDVILAAFDFIDSFDEDDATLAIPPPSRPRPRKVRRTTPRLTSSQRTRNEICRLRGLATELETQLSQLTHSDREPADGETLCSSEARCTKSLRQWEIAARRQKTQRQRAQEENERLREELKKHTSVVRKLEKLIASEWQFQQAAFGINNAARHLLVETAKDTCLV